MLGRAGGGAAAGSGGNTSMRATTPPSYRVPGASMAAKAAAAAGGAGGPTGVAGAEHGPKGQSAAGAAGGSLPPPATPTGGARSSDVGCVTDSEGFQLVRGKSWRRGRATASQGAVTGGGSVDEGGPAAQGGEPLCGPAEEGGGEGGEGDEPRAPAPTDLHRAWQDEVAVVRQLKAQGLASDHPAMRAATEARDGAERAWRDAKDPAPAPVRLARAQAKLDRALELQGDAHTALLEYEQLHRERLAALRTKLQEARERVATRREQLEEIQEEVGAEAQGARTTAAQGAAAAKEVHDTICGTVAPTIAALVEQLDSSTPAWTVLNGLLGTLSTSTTALERAFTRGRGAQRFDIAETTKGGAGGAQAGGGDTSSEWSESHELPEGGSTGHGSGAAGATGTTWAANDGEHWGDAHDDCRMDTDEWGCDQFQDPYWGAASRWEECGHGKWTRASTDWADAWEHEHGRTEGALDQPPPARRRLEPAAGAAAAAAAPATPRVAGDKGEGGTPIDESRLVDQRKRQHADRLQRIVQAAIDAGIQPLTHQGEELQMLDPFQLDAWVAEHLPEGGR